MHEVEMTTAKTGMLGFRIEKKSSRLLEQAKTRVEQLIEEAVQP